MALKYAIFYRDANGIPQIDECPRAVAVDLIKGSCVVKRWTGLTGFRSLVLANGLSIRVDRARNVKKGA